MRYMTSKSAIFSAQNSQAWIVEYIGKKLRQESILYITTQGLWVILQLFNSFIYPIKAAASVWLTVWFVCVWIWSYPAAVLCSAGVHSSRRSGCPRGCWEWSGPPSRAVRTSSSGWQRTATGPRRNPSSPRRHPQHLRGKQNGKDVIIKSKTSWMGVHFLNPNSFNT